MARADLTVTSVSKSGVADPTATAGNATDGHKLANSGRTHIVVTNTSADTAYDVTFITKTTVDGLAVEDYVVEVAADSTVHFSGFQTTVYGSELWIDVENAALELKAFES